MRSMYILPGGSGEKFIIIKIAENITLEMEHTLSPIGHLPGNKELRKSKCNKAPKKTIIIKNIFLNLKKLNFAGRGVNFKGDGYPKG